MIQSSSSFPAIWLERDVRGECSTKTTGKGEELRIQKTQTLVFCYDEQFHKGFVCLTRQDKVRVMVRALLRAWLPNTLLLKGYLGPHLRHFDVNNCRRHIYPGFVVHFILYVPFFDIFCSHPLSFTLTFFSEVSRYILPFCC